MYKANGTVVVGDEVIFVGQTDTYSGTRQLGYGADLISVLTPAADLTDQQKLDLDLANAPSSLILEEDMVLSDGTLGTTYAVDSVSSELTAYIDFTTTPGTLEVTRPDATTGDVTGTLTVTATNGTVSSTITIDVTVLKTVTAIYSTGFETTEGFSSSTNYVGGLTDVNGWTVVEGTVSTTNASAEDMHLQMRDYDSAAGFPYAEYVSTTAFNNVQFYSFSDQASGMQIVVQFSTDGTTWSTGTTIDLDNADTMYEVASDVTDATYVRFTVNHSLTPDKQRVNLDDVVLF
jgi:hypothetical protein